MEAFAKRGREDCLDWVRIGIIGHWNWNRWDSEIGRTFRGGITGLNWEKTRDQRQTDSRGYRLE
jgi:hypothetical protein